MIGPRVGARAFGPVVGPAVGVGTNELAPGGIPGVTRDGTSNVYTPNTAGEMTAFSTAIGTSIPAANHLWRLQEAAGNPADTIGAKTMTASGVAYQKSIVGWTRKAIGGPGTATNTNFFNAAMVDTATTSFAVLMLAQFANPTGGLRSFLSYGVPALQCPMSTAKIRLREGASITDSSSNHDGAVRPFFIVFNVTASSLKLYTDLEKLSVTFSASSGTTLQAFTSTTVDTGSNDFLWMAAWDGAAAETVTDAQAKTYITGMGYSPPWS